MSHVYVTSDWHIGQTGIAEKFRTNFVSDMAHDHVILGAAKAILTKRDVLFVLGDVTWTTTGLQQIKDTGIPARMIMVRGNHDTLPTRDYLEVFEEIHGAYAYKEFFMTHIPIHRLELYRRSNIHGHCHKGGPYEVNAEKEYFNAILEFNDYIPVRMDQVRKIMEERRNK